MKKLLGIIVVAAVLMTTFLPFFSVSAAETDGDYYIYTAEDISTMLETSTTMKYSYETRDGSSFVRFKLTQNKSDAYLRVNFSTASDSAYVPEFNIKDYPIVVVSAKTNVVNTASTLAGNAGMKINGNYQRCWGLNSSTTFATAQTSGVLTKVIFDVSTFSGYDGGSAKWADVDESSGLKFFRIPPWNKTASSTNWADEYFDIEYIGVFKNEPDANAFSYADYRNAQKNTVELYDENGTLIETHYLKSGDTLRLPTRKTSLSKVFVGWKNQETSEISGTSVTVFGDMKLQETYADCIIYTGEDISPWTTVSNFTIQNTCFDEDGNVFVRVSTPEGNQKYQNNDFAKIELGETVLLSEYPCVAIGYRSTITDVADWALSIGLKMGSGDYSGTYKRFWGLSYDHVNGGDDHKMVFDMRNVSSKGEGDPAALKTDIASDTDIQYLRVTPYASNWGVEKTTGQYFDLTYVAFFKDEASARAFEYDPKLYAEGEEKHNAFMLRDGDYAFRPTENLTRAEAASALANLIVDTNTIAGKYDTTFSDVSASAWYYDEVAYLERLGYLGTGSAFNPDSNITKGDLAAWLAAANDAGEDVSEYPGSYTESSTITRADAAKVLCQVSGRTPTADGIRYASTAYFSDVDKSTTNYAYIVEAVYTHGYELDGSNEKWISCDDNDFYIAKASDTLVAELDAEYDRRVAEIRAAEDEWTRGSSWNNIYYVSSKNGNDNNNGKSQSAPFKTLQKIMDLQNRGTIKSGDVVLLERGSEWHTTAAADTWDPAFSCKEGVTYSAYGTGEKPRILGSIEADNASQWTAVSGYPGLYKFNTRTFNLTQEDIGNIVFNNGEMYGQRVIKAVDANKLLATGHNNLVGNGRDFWELDVDKYEFKDYTDILDIVNDQKAAGKNPDLIFYHNWTSHYGGDGYLYLYCAEGNPGDVFDSIEICKKGHVVKAVSNVTIDNWAILCAGGHGVSADTCSNLTVRNCEIGWIGGSVQYVSEKNEIVRFGNGIEIYGGANGFYAYNNYVYQCIDCGPTVQWSGTLAEGETIVQKNVEFYDNVLFDSALEVWLSTSKENTSTTYAKLINCKMYDNLVYGAGYGFGGYNHQKSDPCQFYGGGLTKAVYENCTIENNKMWGSREFILKCVPTTTVEGKGFEWKNNTIIHSYDLPLANLATDPKSISGKTITYTYDNSTLKFLLESETFGYNEFMYTLSDGQEDPIEAHNETLSQKNAVIEIRTAAELMAMRPDGKYKLMADIDLEGIVWSPVGTEGTPFTGVFDGNGYEISNFKADSDSSASMFGVCDGAKITDLMIIGASVTVNGANNDVYAAIIAHSITGKTEISDCSVNGSVTVNTNGTAYAAGICAYNESSDIISCESDVTVTVNAGEKGYAAGICAYLYSDAKLVECNNYGIIDVDAETVYNGGVYAEEKADTSNSSVVPVVENCKDFGGVRPGDANGDGRVTALDVVVMTRATANWTGYEDAVNVENADFNGDGSVTLIDIVYLARHLAGWKGYETLPVVIPQA